MNLYFLVEGKTERKVYPKWLAHLAPQLERVNSPCEAINNNYYLISGGGFPSILDNHLVDSVADVNASGKFDYFVLAIDTDDISAAEKTEEVEGFVRNNDIIFNDCEFIILPQVVCMETWFLGNRRIYSRNSSSAEVSAFTNHYNIAQSDPEKMRQPDGYSGSIGDYHFQYLKSMLRGKNIRYSKKNPQEVTKPYYIDALRNRIELDKNCLSSMHNFFCALGRITEKEVI
ncbi:MAG: hypothetical protein D3914_00535 [Candidatus Electrothrix sp. LOE2]|nr:hypothetical protein [Candidatus Electrothrix sp. LOE2]